MMKDEDTSHNLRLVVVGSLINEDNHQEHLIVEREGGGEERGSKVRKNERKMTK